jgi:pimeloyl-ACP methyl ester carboxylesterase
MGSSWMRSAVVGAGALGAFALAPGIAAAQGVAAQPCPRPVSSIAGARCGTLQVPLDHFGRVPGVQNLAFARIPARGASLGTIAVVPGGPGQPALAFARTLATDLRPVLADHDLLLVDPRGTGASDPTGCRVTADPSSPAGLRQVAACAARLGPRRATLTSEEDARDLEAVRAALGIPKLTVIGVSSGTRVAAEFVRRFPSSADRIVLDSPVAFDGVDALGELPALSFPRVLREVCFPPGSCLGISDGADPRATVGRLVDRLEDAPLRTAVVDSRGRPHLALVSTELLYATLLISDLDPFVRADLPAAIRSGINGDGAYLARLLQVEPIADALPPTAQIEASSDDDVGRFLATTCIEGRLPWKPDAPQAGRAAALRAQLQTLAPKLVPFPPALVASFSAEPACAAWPPTTPQSPVALAAPAVPTLILSGREDLRTPTEDARRTAALYPNVRLLAVPDVGHSVLTSELDICAISALREFLAGTPVANCKRSPRILDDPAQFIPANVDGLRATSGVPGPAGRTLTAVTATIFDASRSTARSVIGGTGPRVGGVRRGTARLASNGTITLRGYETVRGVRVSGTLTIRRSRLGGRLVVSGSSAAAGAITLADARATGTLGGRSFSRVRLSGPLTK